MLESLLKPFRRHSGNLLKEFPWIELDRGVMHTHDGFYVVGVEIDVPNTTFLDNRQHLFETYHYLLRELLPAGARLRQVQEVMSAPYSTVSDYRNRVTAREPGLRWLLDKRADALEASWERGDVRIMRTSLLVRLGRKGKFDASKTLARTETAQRLRDDVMLVFQRLGFACRAMDDDDAYRLCFRFANPDLKSVGLGPYVPTQDFYPKELLKRSRGARPSTFRAQVLKSGVGNARLDRLRLGHSYCRIVAMHTNPVPTTKLGMVHATEHAGDNYVAITDFYTEVAERFYKRQAGKNQWYQGALETRGYIDRETVELAKASTALLDRINATHDKFMQVSSAILLFDTDWGRLERRTRTLYGALSHIPGNPFVILGRGVAEAWSNLAPYTGGELKKMVITTSCANAVHFMPVTGPWKGSKDPQAMWYFANRWFGVTKVSPFEQVGPGGHNVVVVGGTRSGKSFGVQKMLSEALAFATTRAVVIDKGLGYKQLTSLAEGAYIDVAKETFNPFTLARGVTEPDDDDVNDVTLAVRSMIHSEPGERGELDASLIEAAVRSVYKFNRVERAGVVQLKTPTLSEFVKRLGTLTELNGRPLTTTQLEWREALVNRFGRWTGTSTLGRFVDGPSTVDVDDKRFCYFDIEGLVKNPDLALTGVLLVQNFVKKFNKTHRGVPILNVLDEAWTLIKNSPIGRSMVEDSYRTAAKSGVGVITSTQSLDDLPDAVLDNTRIFFFFASSERERERWIERFKLSPAVAALARKVHIIYGQYAEALCIVKVGDRYEGQIVAIHGTGADQLTFTSEHNHQAVIEAAVVRHGGFVAAVESGELAA